MICLLCICFVSHHEEWGCMNVPRVFTNNYIGILNKERKSQHNSNTVLEWASVNCSPFCVCPYAESPLICAVRPELCPSDWLAAILSQPLPYTGFYGDRTDSLVTGSPSGRRWEGRYWSVVKRDMLQHTLQTHSRAC